MNHKNEKFLNAKRRSFRDISREFFKRETQRYFLAELLLFGVIVTISAWPLFSLAEALSILAK